jgi:hypothetical protein
MADATGGWLLFDHRSWGQAAFKNTKSGQSPRKQSAKKLPVPRFTPLRTLRALRLVDLFFSLR